MYSKFENISLDEAGGYTRRERVQSEDTNTSSAIGSTVAIAALKFHTIGAYYR